MSALTIINRHYPPNPGITGESAWDLAKYLIEQHGIQVVIVCVDRSDDGGGHSREPIGDVYTIKTVYRGRNGFLRLISGFLDGFLLMRKASQVGKGPFLVMTSPPLLPFWAALMLRKTGFWLWSMDLFPEGFAAESKISPTNPVYRWIIRQTYRHAPQRLIALGPMQAAHVRAKYNRPDLPTHILPCGVLMHQHRDLNRPEWRPDDGKIYLGYAGNIGAAHSVAFLQSFLQHLDCKRFRLVLALYGPHANQLIQEATGREGVILLPNIPRSQLNWLDWQLVSLRPEWTHIAVPSKAVSAICAGSPIVFCGSAESDTYALLQGAIVLVDAEQTDIDAQVATVLQTLTPALLAEKKQVAEILAVRLQQKVDKTYQELATIAV